VVFIKFSGVPAAEAFIDEWRRSDGV